MAETPRQSQAHAKLEERWSKLGFEALSRPEQEAIALFWLEGEVMNGPANSGLEMLRAPAKVRSRKH